MSRKFWNKAYETDDVERRPWDKGIVSSELKGVVEGLDKCKVLEIGCGTGTNSAFLASSGFDVVGVDISDKAISIARDRYGENDKLRFKAVDFLDMDHDSRYDLVVDIGFFHTVKPFRRKKYLKRLVKVLNVGGKYYLSCFSDSNKDFRPGVRNSWLTTLISLFSFNGPYFFSNEEITELFKGFKILDFHEVSVENANYGVNKFFSVLFERK